jgi:hypothetical protein
MQHGMIATAQGRRGRAVRLFIVTYLSMTLVIPVTKAETVPSRESILNFQEFGIGISKCREWGTDPTMEVQTINWVLGYWSGRNNFNTRNSYVGTSMSAYEIVDRVRASCKQNPSMSINAAVNTVYNETESAGE